MLIAANWSTGPGLPDSTRHAGVRRGEDWRAPFTQFADPCSLVHSASNGLPVTRQNRSTESRAVTPAAKASPLQNDTASSPGSEVVVRS
jgi:hypothetical protein